MNPTKAAAILALIVTLCATGYLCYTFYQEKVELTFQLEALKCMSCTTGKEAAVANWRAVQSHVELLKAQGKYKDAINYEREHAGERPVNIDVPCPTCDVPGPNYATPGGIAVAALIISLALFEAAKPKT